MAGSKSRKLNHSQFPVLEARTLRVSQASVRKKWTKVPVNSQLRIKQLIHSIERSVKQEDGAGTKALEVQLALMNVAETLARKVPRMPFPRKTDDASFDFESTLSHAHALEAQLTADMHSSSLLEAEIEKEQKLLAEDETELENLETAWRDAEATRKRHSKGLHPLARATVDTTDGQGYSDIPVVASKALTPIIIDVGNDVHLNSLLKQVRSHLESMQNNTSSLEDIPAAINSAQAALNCFTWCRFDRKQQESMQEINVT